MAQEIETKVLNVEVSDILQKAKRLGAEELQDTRLTVDWFKPTGMDESNQQWYLRVRSYSSGKVEITWKGKSETVGIARQHEEINLLIDSHEKACDFFIAIGLVPYAHQEKDRRSWKLGDIQLDLDQYPGMPAYLEIEGPSESVIQKTLEDLELQDHETSSEGERILIQEIYRLDWTNMRF